MTLATEAYAPGAAVLSAVLRQQLACQDADIVVFSDCALRLAPGVELRPLAQLPELSEPVHAGEPALPQFRFCWAKLGLWALQEYDLVVYMDADMLPVGDLRPLLDLSASLPRDSIAAVAACECWRDEECHYTSTVATWPTLPALHAYFNAGLLAFCPDLHELESMRSSMAACTRELPFAEQDFLNDHFRGRVVKLPAAFNVLKPALINPKHRDALPLDDCVVLHYVMAKPWQRLSRHEPELAHVHQLWHDAWRLHAPSVFLRPCWADHICDARLACLWCVPDFVTEETENALVEFLHGPAQGSDAAAATQRGHSCSGSCGGGAAAWQRLRRRGVLCMGGVPHPDGSILAPLPGPVGQVAAALQAAGALPDAPPDQCLANVYSAGEGIDPHFDGPCFKPAAAVLTLEGPAIMRFRLVDWRERPDLPRLVEVPLRPRSLLVFQGDAYGLYVHWIEHTAVEVLPSTGETVARAPRRTSLTYRHLAEVRVPASAVTSAELRSAREAQWEWWGTQLGEID